MAFFVNENSFSPPAEFSRGSKVASEITCKYNTPLFFTSEVHQAARWGGFVSDGYTVSHMKILISFLKNRPT